MWRTIRMIALFACLHGSAAIVLLLLAFSASSRRFDTGAVETTGERVIAQAAEILFLPGSLVWRRWASENLPNAVEWLVFVANSLLWGSVIGFLGARVRPSPRVT